MGAFMSRLNSWSHACQQWLQLVIKSPCPLCQRPTSSAFCLDCQWQVQCCQLASPGWQPETPIPAETPIPVFAWGSYQGALKRAIAALKYHHQPQLAVPLGTWMAATWKQQHRGRPAAIVVPIPMYAAKQRERGFNQAELLAKSFCALTGLPLAATGLIRQRSTVAQFQLSGADRAQNVQDAFALGQAFAQRSPPLPVLLFDDILTTGATVQSAAQTLRHHGIRVQGTVVLATSEFSLKKSFYNEEG